MADSPEAKRARTASSPKPPTPKPPAWISTLLPKSIGCGPVKRNALAAAFVDEAALRAASLKELQNVEKVGPTVATKVDAFLTGVSSGGVPVIEMWNTLTKQKCARGSVPKTEDAVKAWLEDHSHCERYDGQDQEGPRASNYVPDDDQLSRDKFVGHVGDNAAGLSDSQAHAQVVETAKAYNLVVGPVYDDDGASANTDNVAALFRALSHANVVNGELNGRTLQNLVADELALSHELLSLGLRGGKLETTQLTDVLDVTPATLGRPLWVVTSVSGRPAVYLLAGPESQAGGSGSLDPLRISYLGGRKFAPLFDKADLTEVEQEVDESGTTRAPCGYELPAPIPLPAGGTGNEGSPADDILLTQLPELKSSLREALSSTLACLDDIQEWSMREKQDFGIGSAESETGPRKRIHDFLQRLSTSDGLTGAFTGDNGVGKSTLINLMMFNSGLDQQTAAEKYKILSVDPMYVPESIMFNADQSEPLPSLSDIIKASQGQKVDTIKRSGAFMFMAGTNRISVELLSQPDQQRKSELTAACRRLIDGIKQYCTTEKFQDLGNNFILPCGSQTGATTIVGEELRFGQITQLVSELFTVTELQQQAFEFVQLLQGKLKELDGDPAELEGLENVQQEELLNAFKKYKLLTEGDSMATAKLRMEDIVKAASDEELAQLPEKSDTVEICTVLKDLVSNRSSDVVIGTGDPSIDRALLGEIVSAKSKDELQMLAIKKMQAFEPSAALEGGTGILDLPGNNTTGAAEIFHTRQGVENAGVVFVLLKRDLAAADGDLKLMQKCGVIKRALIDEGTVVFLFNREHNAATHISAEQLRSPEEENIQKELQTKSKIKWEEALSIENGILYSRGEISKKLSRDKIQAIVNRTEMRCIYPMLYTSWKYNGEHAIAHSVLAEEVSKRANMNWLLGLLEKLNRDDTVKELYHVVTHTLPGIGAKLNASIINAQLMTQEGQQLPAKLIQLAEKMSKSSELFATTRDRLNQEVSKLYLSVCTQIKQAIDSFFESDAITQFLDVAADNQTKRVKKLERELASKDLSNALQVIKPENKGKLPGQSLQAVIFGPDRLEIDFQPLVDNINEKLQSFKEEIKETALRIIDEVINPAPARSTPALPSVQRESSIERKVRSSLMVQQMRDTFQKTNLDPELAARFEAGEGAKTEFYSRKQQVHTLINGRISKYFHKVASEARLTAMHKDILSYHADASRSNVGDITTMIKNNLAYTHETWKDECKKALWALLEKQLKCLQSDLTMKGSKQRFQGLLEGLLRSFFTEVLNTQKAHSNIEYAAELKEKGMDVVQQTNQLLNLWAQVRKQVDPEELGKQATRYFERMRGQQACEKALRTIKLHRPGREPIRGIFLTSHHVEEYNLQHLTIKGKVASIPSFNAALKKPCQLEVQRWAGRATAVANHDSLLNFKDIFSAVLVLCYTRLQICQAAGLEVQVATEAQIKEAIATVANNLRGIVRQRAEERMRPEEWIKLGTNKNDYVKTLASNYAGDLYCLFLLGKELSVNFRVWLPGSLEDNRQKVITIKHVTDSSRFFNIAVTNDMDMDMEIDETQHTTGTHHAVFWPIVKINNTFFQRVGFNMEANKVTNIPAEGNGNPTPAR